MTTTSMKSILDKYSGLRLRVRIACAAWLLLLPAVVQAQFTFTTNNGTISIVYYNGTSML